MLDPALLPSDIATITAALGLLPHPEGGHFRETYRAHATLPSGRSLCTAILYLLAAGEHSKLHRLDADELWHFHRGGPLRIVELVPGGPARLTVLSEAQPQHLVPANTWFGAVPEQGTRYALVGCTVAPGFEFAHFTMGERSALLSEYPEAREWIERLTPSPG